MSLKYHELDLTKEASIKVIKQVLGTDIVPQCFNFMGKDVNLADHTVLIIHGNEVQFMTLSDFWGYLRTKTSEMLGGKYSVSVSSPNSMFVMSPNQLGDYPQASVKVFAGVDGEIHMEASIMFKRCFLTASSGRLSFGNPFLHSCIEELNRIGRVASV